MWTSVVLASEEIALHAGAHRGLGVRLVGVAAAFALTSIATSAGAITYGTIDTTHPFVGAIIVDFQGRFNLGVIEWCSGSLVSPRVFLTAGHCTDGLDVYEIPVDRVWISFALRIWDPGAERRNVVSWLNHPDYRWGPTSDPHDVGAVILEEPADGRGLATLAPVGYLDELAAAGDLRSARFVNVGYGSNQHAFVDGWRKASTSGFLSLHDAWLYMSQNIHTGSGGTCFGDSGGPTFHGDGGAEYVVATVSWGDARCVATNINYRADLASTHAFVASTVAANP
jgi:V8-like Glu-specific endopeptidase